MLIKGKRKVGRTLVRLENEELVHHTIYHRHVLSHPDKRWCFHTFFVDDEEVDFSMEDISNTIFREDNDYYRNLIIHWDLGMVRAYKLYNTT